MFDLLSFVDQSQIGVLFVENDVLYVVVGTAGDNGVLAVRGEDALPAQVFMLRKPTPLQIRAAHKHHPPGMKIQHGLMALMADVGTLRRMRAGGHI